MKLHLTRGYPYPFPDHRPPEEQETINEGSASRSLTIEGVTHFEWVHTVTVEFDTWGSANAAQSLTGWKSWSYRVLEAQTSSGDGYDHPAIVVGNTAYCGFILEE